MQAYIDAAPADHRMYQRDRLRRMAAKYERNTMDLYYWTFPPSRTAVFNAVHRPDEAAVTKRLCKAIYADLILARKLPTFYQRKAARVHVLRELLACECWRYRCQGRGG